MSAEEVPFMVIGAGELEDAAYVQAGDEILCPLCGNVHPLECGKKVLPSGEKVDSEMLLFFINVAKHHIWPRSIIDSFTTIF